MQCPGGDCPWKTANDAERHYQGIVSEIRDLDADIITLTELQGCDVLERLATDLNMGYKHYLVLGGDTATGQNVGLLTRVDPVTDLQRTENTMTSEHVCSITCCSIILCVVLWCGRGGFSECCNIPA